LDYAESQKEDNLLTYMAARAKPDTHPGDIRLVLGIHVPSQQKKNLNVNEVQNTPDSVTVGDVEYYLNKGETIAVNGQHYSAHMAAIQYYIGQHNVTTMDKALIDRGANGGICGADMMVLEGSERFVDVSGLAGHKVNQLRIVTAQAVITTHKGDAIAIFHQMALLGKGKSILSCIQMESHGADINEKPRLLPGGKQRILMDNYQIPLDINNGLAYLRCRPPYTHELETLPHIIMTADVDWNPSIFDNDIDDVETFFDTTDDIISHGPFDQYGEYRFRIVAIHDTSCEPDFFDAVEFLNYDDMIDDLIDLWQPTNICGKYGVNMASVTNRQPDFNLLRPLFGWAPSETIKRTFSVTTQFARGCVSDTLKQHWRSRFPACNVKRRNEPVATDTVFSDTPAVDSGFTAAQLFVGRHSLVADAYGLKTDKEFVNTLEDNILWIN
jgi:hypothetical protein